MKLISDMCNQYALNIDGNQATSKKSGKLVGINIDNKLSFHERVSSLCKKASNQLNVISRLRRCFINSFVNFN